MELLRNTRIRTWTVAFVTTVVVCCGVLCISVHFSASNARADVLSATETSSGEQLSRVVSSELSGVTATVTVVSILSACAALVFPLLLARTVQINVESVVRESRNMEDAIKTGDLSAHQASEVVNEDFQPVVAALTRVAGSLSSLSSIDQCSKALTSSSLELNAVSRDLTRAVEETVAQATEVSGASEQVRKSVETLSMGSEEMASSIKEIAKNAYDAAKVAGTAVKSAEDASTRITQLGESSSEIGKIVTVITSVAEQTNLLALNATIEAARAGKAGKGFAVVANEVKELAKETAKATEDIDRRVQAIQADTTAAIEAIGQINAVIHQMNDYQNTIATAVEEQSVTSGEIGRTISEVAAGSLEISNNVVAIADASQCTSEGASYTQRTAADLAKLANELDVLVSSTRRA